MGWFGSDLFDKVATHTASLSFDAANDAFLYYPDSGSLGIAVSAAERELYIHGSRRQFFAAINGRPATGPKRSRWRLFVRSLVTQPTEMAAISGVFTYLMLRQGLRAESSALQTAFFAAAAFFLINAVLPFVARKWPGKPLSAPTQV